MWLFAALMHVDEDITPAPSSLEVSSDQRWQYYNFVLRLGIIPNSAIAPHQPTQAYL